jgi:hypothetical protein
MEDNPIMKRRLRIMARLVALVTLVTCVGSVTARAGYFDDFYACDDGYYDTLGDCRSNPSYPYDPDESQCRYNSASSFSDCLNAIPEPTYEPDFCAQARAARDYCTSQYGTEGADPDFDAFSECWAASGIDQCE